MTDHAKKEARQILEDVFGIKFGLSSYQNKVRSIADAIDRAEKRGRDEMREEAALCAERNAYRGRAHEHIRKLV